MIGVRPRSARIVRMATGFYSAMLVVGLAWGALRGLSGGWFQFAGAPSPGKAVFLGLFLGLLGVAASFVLERTVAGVRLLGDRFGMVLAGVGVREAITLAALSSVGEELLFRGCLQEEVGLLPATVVFALVHVGPNRDYLWWTGSAFVFGLGLGFLYDAHGGLLGPIVMHFVINAINIALLGRKAATRNADAQGRAPSPRR